MTALANLLIFALDVYLWVIVATVIVSWLVMFDVLNTRNKYVYKFYVLINRATEPVISRIRRYVPVLGGIDISPMILIFGIYLLQAMLRGMGGY